MIIVKWVGPTRQCPCAFRPVPNAITNRATHPAWCRRTTGRCTAFVNRPREPPSPSLYTRGRRRGEVPLFICSVQAIAFIVLTFALLCSALSHWCPVSHRHHHPSPPVAVEARKQLTLDVLCTNHQIRAQAGSYRSRAMDFPHLRLPPWAPSMPVIVRPPPASPTTPPTTSVVHLRPEVQPNRPTVRAAAVFCFTAG
jgi:hypothetical protein